MTIQPVILAGGTGSRLWPLSRELYPKQVINLTGEGRRGHLRSKNNVTFVQPGFARYAAGVRFSF